MIEIKTKPQNGMGMHWIEIEICFGRQRFIFTDWEQAKEMIEKISRQIR